MLTNPWISLICHHGTSKNKQYGCMVQVPSVFQGSQSNCYEVSYKKSQSNHVKESRIKAAHKGAHLAAYLL